MGAGRKWDNFFTESYLYLIITYYNVIRMDEIFKTKVRKLGSSFGVLIPKRMIKENRIKLGEEVEIALLKKQKKEAIERLMGIAEGAGPFVRERADRV